MDVRFPALGTSHVSSLVVLIGSLRCAFVVVGQTDFFGFSLMTAVRNLLCKHSRTKKQAASADREALAFLIVRDSITMVIISIATGLFKKVWNLSKFFHKNNCLRLSGSIFSTN